MDDLIEMLSLFTHDHNLQTVAINYLLNPVHVVHYPDYLHVVNYQGYLHVVYNQGYLHVVCYQGYLYIWYLSIIEFVRYHLSYLFDMKSSRILNYVVHP